MTAAAQEMPATRRAKSGAGLGSTAGAGQGPIAQPG